MLLIVTVARPQVCDSRVSTPRMELDMIDKACKSDAPAVMLVSQQDCVVVFELQRRVVDACRGPSRPRRITPSRRQRVNSTDSKSGQISSGL